MLLRSIVAGIYEWLYPGHQLYNQMQGKSLQCLPPDDQLRNSNQCEDTICNAPGGQPCSEVQGEDVLCPVSHDHLCDSMQEEDTLCPLLFLPQLPFQIVIKCLSEADKRSLAGSCRQLAAAVSVACEATRLTVTECTGWQGLSKVRQGYNIDAWLRI
jgi:hypothetical protein